MSVDNPHAKMPHSSPAHTLFIASNASGLRTIPNYLWILTPSRLPHLHGSIHQVTPPLGPMSAHHHAIPTSHSPTSTTNFLQMVISDCTETFPKEPALGLIQRPGAEISRLSQLRSACPREALRSRPGVYRRNSSRQSLRSPSLCRLPRGSGGCLPQRPMG